MELQTIPEDLKREIGESIKRKIKADNIKVENGGAFGITYFAEYEGFKLIINEEETLLRKEESLTIDGLVAVDIYLAAKRQSKDNFLKSLEVWN